MIDSTTQLTVTSSNVSGPYYNLQWSRFRKIKSFQVDLPSTGILLLDGISGIGKSTIFEAISFALHDDAGNKCYPRDEKSSKKKPDSTWVQLTFPDGLTIYRQRRPNLLKVFGRGVDLVDASAQSYLNRIIGSLNNWLVGGYLRQWELCAFFTMSCDDKLNLIQKISTSEQFTRDISPEQFEILLNKTHERIVALSRLQELEMQVKIYAEMYMKIFNVCSDEVKAQSLWSPEITASYYQKYKVSNLNDLLPKIRYETNQQCNMIRSEISKAQIQIASIKERDRLQEMLNINEKQIQEDNSSLIQEYEKMLNDINEQISLAKRTERRSQLLLRKSEIQNKLDLIPLDVSKYNWNQLENFDKILKGPTIQTIDEQLIELELLRQYRINLGFYNKYQTVIKLEEQLNSYPKESVNYLIEEINQKLWALSMQKKKLICPSCSSSLQLTDGKLETHCNIEIAENLNDLNMQKSKLLKDEALYQQSFHIAESLKTSQNQLKLGPIIKEQPIKPKLVDFKFDIEMTINQLNESKRLRLTVPENIKIDEEKNKLMYTQERNRLLTDITNLNKELDTLSENSELTVDTKILEIKRDTIGLELKDLRNKNTLRATLLGKKEQLLNQLSNYPNRDELPIDIIKLQEELSLTLTKSENLEKEINAQIQLTQLSELYKQHSQYSTLHQESVKRLMALQKIKSSLITAEYIILDTVLTEINNTIAEILDILFINPISVTIRTLKQLKTDDRIKPQISCQIISEGSECSSIMGLSGGERIKVSLAMAIAFSKFSDAPFLILDESLSTLDAVTKESTIKMLRHYLPHKLIMTVNHDTTVGVYNSVISLS